MRERLLLRVAPPLFVALVLITLSFPTSASSDTASHFDMETPLARDEWVALRFNLTAGSDLRIDGRLMSCHEGSDEFRTTAGRAVFVIVDAGRTRLYALNPGGVAWGQPGSEVVSAGIQGQRIQPPNMIEGSSCGWSHFTVTANANSARESLTLLLMTMAPSGGLQLRAQWSVGVVSHDLARGEAIAKTKDDFEQGAHVSYYPLPTGAGAGLASRTDVDAPFGFVGYFLPEAPGSGGTSQWRCSLGGAPCPAPNAIGVIELAGGPGTLVTVQSAAEARVGESPYYALAGIRLPDRTYLH